MANDNFARGLIPLNYPMIKTHYYRVSTSQDIYLGQPVDMASTGYVTNAIDVTTAGIVMCMGVAVGFSGPDKAGTAVNAPYLKSADLTTLATGLSIGDRYVEVADDPQQLFIVQGDTGATLNTLANIFESYAMIYRATSGNTNSGWSNLEMDASTNAASTGQLLQVINLHETLNSDGTKNVANANYTKWIVKILNHRLRGQTGQTTI